ncbi:unnamed protein product [Soboliphyme baturini]|uniref:ER membrane protein complex subunit 2 n=1 Tax=Soboliphyme baturini TaxID=241478 RepID=A0A183IJV1_9BILA|nr:unnamed protein product [Soboliphyme baturini]
MSEAIKDWTLISFDEGRHTLRKWREDNCRRSEETVEIWEHVLSRRPAAFHDELWIVYEQVYIAALDCANMEVAQDCLSELYKKFNKSRRLLKLEAMMLEATGRYPEAVKLYDSLIKMDETNPVYYKRRIAVLMAQGKNASAIRDLCEYLKLFMNDTEAWMQLAQLHLSEADYVRSAHCVEELILTNPQNYLYHLLFAEIRYSQDGTDNLELAKAYYCEALKLNPTSIRASWGYFMCLLQLCGRSSTQKKKENCYGLKWITEHLQNLYKEQKTTHNKSFERQMKCVEKMLNSAKKVDLFS